MARALITGITGQDGLYLSELVLSKGYEVFGLITAALASMEQWIGPLMAALALLCLAMLVPFHDSPFKIVFVIGVTIGVGLAAAESLATSGIIRSALRLRRQSRVRAS